MTECSEGSNYETKVFATNRDKLIKTLLYEITLLDMTFYRVESMDEREIIKIALECFENLMKIKGYDETPVSDNDYNNMVKFIHDTMESVLAQVGG